MNSKSLITGNIADLLTDWGELAIDSNLADGVLKDIPILGSLVKLYKSGENVREHLFSKKVEKIIKNMSGVSEEEVSKFNYQINSDPEYRTKVAEHLTLLIDRLDDIDKSEFLAKAFIGFSTNRVDFNKFKRLARAIERCMVEDLREVHNFERANDAYSDITADLAACGLIEMVQLPQVARDDVKPMYKISKFGELFVKVVLI